MDLIGLFNSGVGYSHNFHARNMKKNIFISNIINSDSKFATLILG
jgi:hypothetical protein